MSPTIPIKQITGHDKLVAVGLASYLLGGFRSPTSIRYKLLEMFPSLCNATNKSQVDKLYQSVVFTFIHNVDKGAHFFEKADRKYKLKDDKINDVLWFYCNTPGISVNEANLSSAHCRKLRKIELLHKMGRLTKPAFELREDGKGIKREPRVEERREENGERREENEERRDENEERREENEERREENEERRDENEEGGHQIVLRARRLQNLADAESEDEENDEAVRPQVEANQERLNGWDHPEWSYPDLIAIAIKNSNNGSLPTAEIYNFIAVHFPFYRFAHEAWKNAVRHHLSVKTSHFHKVGIVGPRKRGARWAILPSSLAKVDANLKKWRERDSDPTSSVHGLTFPEDLEKMIAGEIGIPPMQVFNNKKKRDATPIDVVTEEENKIIIDKILNIIRRNHANQEANKMSLAAKSYRNRRVRAQKAKMTSQLTVKMQIMNLIKSRNAPQMDENQENFIAEIILQNDEQQQNAPELAEIQPIDGPGLQINTEALQAEEPQNAPEVAEIQPIDSPGFQIRAEMLQDEEPQKAHELAKIQSMDSPIYQINDDASILEELMEFDYNDDENRLQSSSLPLADHSILKGLILEKAIKEEPNPSILESILLNLNETFFEEPPFKDNSQNLVVEPTTFQPMTLEKPPVSSSLENQEEALIAISTEAELEKEEEVIQKEEEPSSANGYFIPWLQPPADDPIPDPETALKQYKLMLSRERKRKGPVDPTDILLSVGIPCEKMLKCIEEDEQKIEAIKAYRINRKRNKKAATEDYYLTMKKIESNYY